MLWTVRCSVLSKSQDSKSPNLSELKPATQRLCRVTLIPSLYACIYVYYTYIYTHIIYVYVYIYIIWLGGWPKKRTYNRTPETIPAVWGRGGRWADRALISEGMDQLCYVRCYPWYMDRWFRNRSNWIVYIYDNILNYIIHNMI